MEQQNNSTSGPKVCLADYERLQREGKVHKVYDLIRAHGTVRVPKRQTVCQHHTYAGTKRSKKYAQIRFEGVKYYCHIIACMVQCGRAPQPDEEASHRCGDPRCVLAAHLVFEDGETNKTRLCCHKYLLRHPGYICPHSPDCLV